jgi:hypothetical protein
VSVKRLPGGRHFIMFKKAGIPSCTFFPRTPKSRDRLLKWKWECFVGSDALFFFFNNYIPRVCFLRLKSPSSALSSSLFLERSPCGHNQAFCGPERRKGSHYLDLLSLSRSTHGSFSPGIRPAHARLAVINARGNFVTLCSFPLCFVFRLSDSSNNVGVLAFSLQDAF